MRPDEIMRELLIQKERLEAKDEEVVELIKEAADADRNFRIALEQESSRLRMKSTPVTMIKALAEGERAVAQKKYDYVRLEGNVKACFKSMDNIRASIDLLRSLLSHESKELHSNR